MDRFALPPVGRLALVLSVGLAVGGCGAGATLADDDARPLVADRLVADRLETLGRNLNALAVPGPMTRSPLGEILPPTAADPFPDPPDPPRGN